MPDGFHKAAPFTWASVPHYLLTAFPHPADQAIHNIAPFTDSIIAFNSSNESAFCQGDSGGPLHPRETDPNQKKL